MNVKNLAHLYRLIRKHNATERTLSGLLGFQFGAFETRQTLDAINSLQATTIALVTAEQNESALHAFRLDDEVRSMHETVRSIGASSKNELLKIACDGISGWPDDLLQKLHKVLPLKQWDAIQAAQIFFQEGMGRDGTYATPTDISELMWATAGGPKEVDIYAKGGVGIFLGLMQSSYNLNLRFALPIEFKSGKSNTDEERMLGIQDRVESAFAELLQILIPLREQSSKTLLINAATNLTPIAGEVAGLDQRSTALNHVIESEKYQSKAMLLPNSVLSVGHGPYKCHMVFERLVKMGLELIREFQHCLARRDEKFSILLFGVTKPSCTVRFEVLKPENLNSNEVNKFGKVRRAQTLRKDFAKHLCTPNILDSSPTLDELLEGRPPKSFEPGRIVPIPLDLPAHLIKMELEKACDRKEGIHRFQHIEQDPTETFLSYMEIGAADIDSYGQIDVADPEREKRYYDKEESETVKRNSLDIGDVILCVKGSIGKVALIERLPEDPNESLIANQSFVRLRLSQSACREGLTPQLLFWWLRSELAQKHLKSKVVAAGVPRIPISDVLTMNIPVGPSSYLDAQAKVYAMWKVHVKQVLESAEQASVIQSSSWR